MLTQVSVRHCFKLLLSGMDILYTIVDYLVAHRSEVWNFYEFWCFLQQQLNYLASLVCTVQLSCRRHSKSF